MGDAHIGQAWLAQGVVAGQRVAVGNRDRCADRLSASIGAGQCAAAGAAQCQGLACDQTAQSRGAAQGIDGAAVVGAAGAGQSADRQWRLRNGDIGQAWLR